MRYLKGYKWCHSNICDDVHKNARFKCQPSTPMQSFVSIKSTHFMEIDDKGEKLEQRYLNASWGEVEIGHGEGATLKNGEGSKFLDKRSTQVGGASS
jgi:4-aminobutyrate aminotransferase-like enzyme